MRWVGAQAALESRGSVVALGSRLPVLLESLHAGLRQSMKDMQTVAQAHAACADVASLCSQVRPVHWHRFAVVGNVRDIYALHWHLLHLRSPLASTAAYSMRHTRWLRMYANPFNRCRCP
jgi:hypothetical protein